LLHIAQKRNIDVEEHKKNLGKAIADDAFSTGIKKLVELMPVVMLDEMGVETKNEDGKKLARSVVRKRIVQKMQEDTPQKFLEGLDTKVQGEIVDLLLDEKPASKKYVETIIQQIDSMGLENALSSLTIDELRQLAKAHKVKVHSSTSVNAYIEALLSGQDQKKSKKEKKEEEPSKKKPAIKKGISKVDLRQHYYRDELIQYCKDNNLPTTGHVTHLINRIVDHLEGKPVKAATSKKRKAPATSTKEKPAKKAKTEKSKEGEKSEKSTESEKGDKSEKGDESEDEKESGTDEKKKSKKKD